MQFSLVPVTSSDLASVLAIYEQCEDFLALGPVPQASVEMVYLIWKSQKRRGTYYGIYTKERQMIGVVDYVLAGYEGNPAHAYLSLLMIASPYRSKGIGRQIVEMVEADIMKNPSVTTILSGVQVNNPVGIAFWQKMGYRIASQPKPMPDQTTVYDLEKKIYCDNY
jgi:ribosomal protein S18 acetylase RimI-like enzyme